MKLPDTRQLELIRLMAIAMASVILAIFLINIFFDLTEMIGDESVVALDDTIMVYILSYRSEMLTNIMVIITTMGNAVTYFILIPLSALILYLLRHRWLVALEAALILISAAFLNTALKNWISRPRPSMELHLISASSFSYPSGHAMSAMTFYGFLIFLVYRYVPSRLAKWILIFFLILLILGIGVSRIYLGVHYPSDVIAGYIGGAIWLVICIFLLEIPRYAGILGQKESR